MACHALPTDDPFVTRPSFPLSAPDGRPADDDEELAIEVDALISEMGVDASSFEVEAIEPVQAAEGDREDDDEGFVALDVDDLEGDNLDVDAIWSKNRPIDPEVHEAEIALVEAHAKARMAAEVAQVKAQAAAERQAELDRLEAEAAAKRDAAVAEARAQAEQSAREALSNELARLESEGEARREAAVAEARAQAEQAARDALKSELERLQHEAAATREAAVSDVRAQAEASAREALQ